ncbi:MAG: CHAT domain-containing protein [Bacteroidota bacterium]
MNRYGLLIGCCLLISFTGTTAQNCFGDFFPAILENCSVDFEATRQAVQELLECGDHTNDHVVIIAGHLYAAGCYSDMYHFQEGMRELEMSDSLLILYKDSLGADYMDLYQMYLEKASYSYSMLGDNTTGLKINEIVINMLEGKESLSKQQQKDLEIAYFNKGNMYKELGEYQKALQAYVYIMNLPNTQRAGLALKHAGDVYFKLGRYHEAYDSYTEALSFHDLKGKEQQANQSARNRHVTTHLALANFFLQSPRVDLKKAREHLDEASRIQNGKKNELYEKLNLKQAELLQQEGKFDEAGDILRTVINFQEKKYGTGSFKVTETKRILTKYAFQAGKDASVVLNLIGESIGTVSKKYFYIPPGINDKKQLLLSLNARAHYQPSPAQKWKDLEWALALVDSLKISYNMGQDKLSLLQETYNVYENSLAALYELNQHQASSSYSQEVLDIMESSKSLLLLESLKRSEAVQAGYVPERLIEKERSLQLNIAALVRKTSQAEKGERKTEELRQLNEALFAVRSKHNQVLDSIRAYSEPFYDFRYGKQEGISLEAIQQRLSVDQVILEYFVGEENIFVLLIDKKESKLEKLPYDENLVNLAADLKTLLSKPPQDARKDVEGWNRTYISYTKAAHTLYEELISSFLTDSSKRKITIVPDGFITAIPFEALLSEPASTERPTYRRDKLAYLINDFEFSYAYSLETMLRQRERHRREEKEFEFTGFAPKYSGPLLATRLGEQDFTSRGANFNFSQLKYNQEEIEKIASSFSEGKAKSFYMEEANKAKMLEHAQRSDILHFAMHSFLNQENPLYSGLVFYEDGKGKLDESILFAYELMGMKLNSEMVVLSMCGSESGSYKPGQGLMSLARAFAFAECPSMIASQWSVADRTTAEIMVNFYHELAKGADKDESLRKAKLTYLDLDQSRAELYHPNYWAAFVQIGNNQPLSMFAQDPFWSSWPLLGLGIAIVLGVLIFFILRRNRATAA